MGEDSKCVYVFEMSNSTIKIGVSNNVQHRSMEISSLTRLKVINIYNSEMFNRNFAFDVETIFKHKFASNRVTGEFFNVPFEDACAELKKIIVEYKCKKDEHKRKYDTISFDVRKGVKKYYKHEAAKRGLWLSAMIQKAVAEYIENHKPE